MYMYGMQGKPVQQKNMENKRANCAKLFELQKVGVKTLTKV